MSKSQRRLTPAPAPEQIPAGFGQATSRALRVMRERAGIDDTITEERVEAGWARHAHETIARFEDEGS